MITRRQAARLLGSTVAAAWLAAPGESKAQGNEKIVKIGIALPLTGADAESAQRILKGAEMALDDANAKHKIPGYQFRVMVYDNGTATAGQYDPAQAATNARRIIADGAVAAVGPQMSGSGKAMAPILSEGDLATITPTSTNPDITDPKFASEYDPSGKAVYFRTVTTDAYQGPELANYFAETLGVKSVYVLDDSGAYGVGLADAFQKQAGVKGMKVMGRDRLDPKAADYSAVMTKIKALNPMALYYGGVAQAGVKVAKQSYEIIPKMTKGGGDGMYAIEMLTAVGFPAIEGWYATIAAPHTLANPDAAAWVKRYSDTFHMLPDDYAITAYDAGLVIVDAVKRVVAAGKTLNKANVRNAIQTSHVKTLQGVVSFDKYGDLTNHTISIFQIREDKSYPLTDIIQQYHYVGVAPAV
jgi:branched-chain amino acid transport system substrate-binding protein